MIIQKVIEFRLDLIDSNDIYTQNMEEMTRRILTEMFVGKCFNSCYILKINTILKTSEIYMSDDLNGSARCDVCFEVDGLVYLKGEIINGCTIRKIESGGQTYAETNIVSLQFKQDPILSIFKEGYIIPAIIDSVRYPVNKDKISALARPFAPEFPPNIIYKINKRKINTEDKCLNKIIQRVKEEEDKIKTLNKKSFDFFKNLLYPFKKIQPIPNKTNFKEVNIFQYNSIKDGYICRPIEMEKFLPVFYHSTRSPAEEQNITIPNISLFEIMMVMLNDYLQYLVLLREMVEFYPDYKTITNYSNVWKLYNQLKLDK